MTKEKTIKRIKEIINEYGSVSTGELELDSSPMVNSIGGKIFQLVEYFRLNTVSTTVYHDDIELFDIDVNYNDLSKDVLDEILDILVDYETDMEKTYKRMSD